MKKNILLFVLLAIGNAFGQSSVGQNTNNYNIDLYPKSPEAYAFAKFVDIPAGSNTGVANFNIPIYTIEVDGLTIPIQLDYSTVGVKVDEIASRVGLGWNLNAGPSLTMQVVGSGDHHNTREILDPSLFNPNGVSSIDDPSYQLAIDATGNGLAEPIRDLKPDIYSYSINSYSGKFIIDSKNPIGIPIPYYPIEIKKESGSITIKDDQGNEYLFFNLKQSINHNTCASVVSEVSNSTFILKKILTKNKKVIEYEYDFSARTKFATGFSEQEKIDEIRAISYYHNENSSSNNGPTINSFCLFYTFSNEPVLKKIKYENNVIEFNYNVNNSKKERQDLPGEVFLEEILVKNNLNTLIKNFKLNQDTKYFSSYLLDLHKDLLSSDLIKGIDKRLKLVEIKEVLSNQKYTLEYYEDTPLINRFSFAQDYWGVYNGETQQKSSIATSIISDFNSKRALYGSSDKTPDFKYGVIGNLKKINYPTGGYLTIEYEPDQYFKEESTEDIVENNSVSYSTNGPTPYVDFNVKDKEILNVKLYFTGDNDDGSGLGKVGNCNLTIIDKSSNKRIITSNQYITGNGLLHTDINLRGKSLRMSIQKGHSQSSPEPIECFAIFSWSENEKIIIPEYNESIGTVRVKNITLNDNNSNKISRNYQYTVPGTTKESGVLHGENKFRSFYTSLFTKGNTLTAGMQRIITNNPGWQINTVNGKSVTYKHVTETYKNLKKESENYTKITMFNNNGCSTHFNGYSTLNFIYPICKEAFLQGKIKEEVLKNNEDRIVKKTIFDYKEDTFFNKFSSSALPQHHSGIEYGLDIIKIQDAYGLVPAKFEYNFFSINNAWVQNTTTITTDYFPNGNVVTTTENNYSPTYKHLYPVSTTTKNSKDETLTTEYQYPPDLVGQEDYMKELTDANRIAEPVVIKQKVGETYISEVHNQYNLFNGIIQKAAVHQKKGVGINVKTSIVDRKITYNSYDTKGNLTQYTLENGIPVAIIWGYNEQYPIAKIEGATSSEVNSYVNALQVASNKGTLTKDTFNNMRTALPNTMITTYVYKPLVGVTSITAPNRQSEFYNYDSSNRLKSIVNDKGETLKTFEYHYKN